MNLKALITLALFVRVVLDPPNKIKFPPFLSVKPLRLLMFFILYIYFISFGQDLLTLDLIKQGISAIFCTYCAYYFFMVKGNTRILYASVVCAGLVCFADLAYTYISFGAFPVQRIYLTLTGVPPEEITDDSFFMSALNHNFFGQVCGTAFVFILTDLFRTKLTHWYNIVLLPLMILGVLMSTSRSSLMALIIVSVLLIYSGIKHKEQRKKVYKFGSFAIMAIVVGILFFSTLGMYFKLDSKFADEVVFRLTEEPLAIIQKALGQNYNIQNLGSMNWREEASANAYEAYMRLNITEQMTGIGMGGFMERGLGHGLQPHNGILLILIESGLIGLVLYIVLIGGVLRRAFLTKNFSPAHSALVFTLIYGIGQNGEMTSLTNFLFVIALIAENQFQFISGNEPSHNLKTSQA